MACGKVRYSRRGIIFCLISDLVYDAKLLLLNASKCGLQECLSNSGTGERKIC